MIIRLLILFFSFNCFSQSIQNLPYSIGNPSGSEQLYLELVNRARADPIGEGIRLANTQDPLILSQYRFFGVDTNLLVQQFSSLVIYPPLSFNSNLIFAARSHSQDQYTNGFQSHLGSDGSSPAERVARAGYGWLATGENIFAASKSCEYGHAGFEVDWGCCGIGGMQSPPGHRYNIHGGSYSECGIGVVNGINGYVGPQIVTQEFATRLGVPIFITGVVYIDLNTNNFYDVDEGIGNVFVNVDKSDYYAISSDSGGYSIPVYSNGIYRTIFTDSFVFTNVQTATISNYNNIKIDCKLQMPTNTIIGRSYIVKNQTNIYSFSPFFGKETRYNVEVSNLVPLDLIEGAEQTNNVRFEISTNYIAISNTRKNNGTNSFHLCHPQPVKQSVYLNYSVKATNSSKIRFFSRFGYASSNQVAQIEYRVNNKDWRVFWEKKGNSSAGDSVFVGITNLIGFLTGEKVDFRFSYNMNGGSYFNQTDDYVGWCFDDISFENCLYYTNLSKTAIGTNRIFEFSTPFAIDTVIDIRPIVNDSYFPIMAEKIVKVAPFDIPTRIRMQETNIFVGFNSIEGKNYRLQKGTNFVDWLTLTNVLSGNGLFMEFGDGFSKENRRMFYRVFGEN